MTTQQINNRTQNNRSNSRRHETRRQPEFRPDVLNEQGEQISLFIPRVDTRTTFEKVSFIFHHYYFGKVKDVDFILKQDKNGREYNAAYVHFDYFYNSENCCRLIDAIRQNKFEDIRCDKYDDKKNWSVYFNTGKKQGANKERLNLDLLEATVMLEESFVESAKASPIGEEDSFVANIRKELLDLSNKRIEKLMAEIEDAKKFDSKVKGSRVDEVISMGIQAGFVSSEAVTEWGDSIYA